MEAQPLETIPEETAAKTSDVPKTKPATAKNPGCVASDKRLAERNRLAREAKKQAEAQKPTNSTTNANANTEGQSSINSGYLILGVGGLIVSTLGVYYQREAILRTLGRSPKTQTTQPASSSTTTVDAVDPPPARPKVKCGISKRNISKSYIYTMKTDGLLSSLGYASLTFMWLQTNRLFFSAIADLVHVQNKLIRKKAIDEYNESLINDGKDESEDESEDE